jgi:hypothetical protein
MIYKQPSIYKSGLSEDDVKNLMSSSTNINISILPKYRDKLVNFGGNIKFFDNLKFLSSTFWLKNQGGDFTPSYDPSDPGGNASWPCIGEGEFPIQTNEKSIDFTILNVEFSPTILHYGSYKIMNGKIYFLFKASTGPIKGSSWINSPQFMADLND